MAVVNVGRMRMIVLLCLVAMPVRMCSGDVSRGVGVAGNGGATGIAEQLMHRHPRFLALDVPEGRVNPA